MSHTKLQKDRLFEGKANHDFTGRVYRWINGITPMPERFIITPTCIRLHGVDGKTVRYKSNNMCVLCSCSVYREASYRRKAKAAGKEPRDLTALNAFEDRQYEDDDDPLFDE